MVKSIKDGGEMFENKKLVIFDLDGTLIDSIGVWNEIDRTLIKTISKNFDNVICDNIQQLREQHLKTCHNNRVYYSWCDCLRQMCASNIDATHILFLRNQIAKDFLIRCVRYKPNAAEVLKTLRANGLQLALATFSDIDQVDIYRKLNKNIIKEAKFDEMFSLILCREDVSNIKPDPEIYTKVLQKLNVSPEASLVVEDSLAGVQAAISAGIEAVSIYDKYSNADRDSINKLSKTQFSSFDELLTAIKNEFKGNS